VESHVLTFTNANSLELGEGSIDEENGIIRGVSIATAGVEAVGHGVTDENGDYRPFWTDQTTIQEMYELCINLGQPLKAKMEHGSGLDAIVGDYRDFRIDGMHLRADLHTYETSSHRAHLFTIAKNLSGQFGVSVTAILRKVRAGAIDLMRCIEVLSADFVDEPAINAALFSKQNKKTKMEKEEIMSAITEAMKPLGERLSKLEETYSEKKEEMQASSVKTEEMSEAVSKEVAELKTQITDLSKQVKEGFLLGLKRGAGESADVTPDEKEVTFKGEMTRLMETGLERHQAYNKLCQTNMPLVQAEAKAQGKYIHQLL